MGRHRMKVTKRQLRRIIREAMSLRESTIPIKLPTDNPWIDGPTIEVDRSEAEQIAQVVADAAEALRDRKFQSAHAYDKPINQAIAPHLPGDKQERYAMRGAVLKVLAGMRDSADWYDGANAAHRTLQSTQAYATPGFVEARRNADIYGS